MLLHQFFARYLDSLAQTQPPRLGILWWLILVAIVALMIGIGGWGVGWWGHRRGPPPPPPPGLGMPPRKGGMPQ